MVSVAACGGGADTEPLVENPPPTPVSISLRDAAPVDENATNATLTYLLELSAASTADIDVTLETRAGTAVANADFVPKSQLLTIPAGAASVEFGVLILDDRVDEPDETVNVEIVSASSGTVNDGSAVGTIVDDDAPPVVAAAHASTTEGDSGQSLLGFEISLSSVSGFDVTVDYSTADGTATAGSDYIASSGSVSIPAGTTKATVQVPVLGDALVEGNETLTLTLDSPVNASLNVATATGTIVDDDDPVVPPNLSVAIADAGSVAENAASATLAFVVSLSEVSGQDVVVQYESRAGSAQPSSDFIANAGAVTIPAGMLSATVNIAVLDDSIDEPDEFLFVDIVSVSAGSIAKATATGTITDNDAAPGLSVADTSVAEGDAGSANLVFTLTLSTVSVLDVTVEYATADGTATAGSDYTATSGTATIAAGATQTTVTVPVLGDTLAEPDETLTLNLSNPANASLSTTSATGTITDNDAAPGLSAANTSVAEGDAGSANLVFTLTLSTASALDVTVEYATADGTATAGSDYTATSGTATIAAGATQTTVTVPVLGDTLAELDETLTLSLSNPTNASLSTAVATGTITNDDATPGLSVADTSVAEGDAGSTDLVFTLTLSTASALDVTVEYATADGTATAGSDYAVTSGTATIVAGLTQTSVTVPVLGDTLAESNETLTLNLSNPANASLSTTSVTGTITNDDAAPGLSVADTSVAEGDAGSANLVFTLILSTASALDVTVEYATVDGTATAGNDYTATSGTATIAAGATQTTVTVPVTGDTLAEPDETLTLSLSNPANASLTAASATGTITNDDAAPGLSIADTSVAEGDAGSANLVFTLTLSTVSALDVTVEYATADGTATAGSDYTATSGTATIVAGTTQTTVSVPVLGDTLAEPDETLTLSLSNPTNASLSTTSATGTITDDDAPSGLSSRPSNTTCIAPDRPTNNASIAVENAFPTLPSLVKPVALLQAPGDTSQWYAVEQDGRVLRFDNSAGVSTTATFIDIRSPSDPIDVDSGDVEAGLLGMAFDPGYGSANWDVYLSYMIDGSPYTSVIARFESKDSGQTLDATDATVLMTVDQPFTNHNGGQISFGPDGYLYIHFGDGGSGGDPGDRAQNTRNLFGSLLRIDVDGGPPYAIPADNPFVGNALCNDGDGSSACPEIYAWGLRNAWRWSFDAPTGQLWLGDVGQNNWEEIDIIELGGNYGWRCREGANDFDTSGVCPDGLIDPVIEYNHSVGISVTGGYVYRGSAIPELAGRYVFADYAQGKLFASVDNGDGTYGFETLLDTSDFIASFAVEASGELLYLNYAGGNIRRIVQSGGSSVDTIADQLSATGCVMAGNPTLPADGLIPYEPNAPFWSDGAVKQRWYAIPDGTSIDVNADGDWLFPIGTVLVKSFRLSNQLVETRLFMRHTDGEWAGYTYEWNAAQTEATRVVGGKVSNVVGQDWIYPSGSDCMQCHTAAANFSLSLEHAQLNGDFLYPSTSITANQLVTADAVDLLTDPLPNVPEALPRLADPTDVAESLEDRARAYLHSNCANCHRPGGPTPSNMDLRYATALADTNTCDATPVSGTLGITNGKLIAPGSSSTSLLVERASRRDSHGMPPLASNLVDTAGVQLLADWIDSLSSCP